jgi:uncharacterized protein YbaA (DUF1428 family)
MKRAIGLPATTARAPSKKRGFYSELAANAAGHIHVPGRHSSELVSCFVGSRPADGKLASFHVALHAVDSTT